MPYEKEYLRKDGSRVPIELFVQPIFDEDGALLHYRSFLTDISARKQAEQRLLDRETEAARLDEGLPGTAPPGSWTASEAIVGACCSARSRFRVRSCWR